MKKLYMILAFLIAFEVVVQATTIAWSVFGLSNWVDDGNVYNKAVADCEGCDRSFTAQLGLEIHSINGFMIISLISLILLIVSFFAKIPGGIKWAVAIFVLMVLQGHLLPGLASDVSDVFGALHGLNALILFAVAVMAGKRVRTATASTADLPVAP